MGLGLSNYQVRYVIVMYALMITLNCIDLAVHSLQNDRNSSHDKEKVVCRECISCHILQKWY